MVMRFSSIHWLLGYSRDFAFFGTVRSFVPSLHDGLLCDLSPGQFDHSNAEHLRPAGIGAALTEGQSITFGCVDVDLMGHRAAADVVPEGCNGVAAPDFVRPARRSVVVAHPQRGVVGVECWEHLCVAGPDGVSDRRTGRLISL